MNATLSDADRRAVDLFLDQGSLNVEQGVKEIIPAVSEERLAAVASLLNLLDQIPVSEPPAKLIEKTMRRIDTAIGEAPGQPVRPHSVDPSPA